MHSVFLDHFSSTQKQDLFNNIKTYELYFKHTHFPLEI